MTVDLIILTSVLFLVVSFMYASVGHAGASGYLAIMALLSFPVATIKPISLILNIIVASLATYHFLRQGRFDRKVFTWFAISSIPMAFVGGYLQVDMYWFKIIAGVFLLVSALFMMLKVYIKPIEHTREPSIIIALMAGAAIGLLSGLLGVGGGIFLSPIIILMGWASVKNTSGIAALFILCNSVLGLSGHYLAVQTLPMEVFYFVGSVIIGGYFGAHFGSTRFPNRVILVLLFIILFSAGLKFLFVG